MANQRNGAPERRVPAGRRAGNGARRREILDVAAEIFFEKGYDAASIQDIADGVGLLKSSLYHYIRTKEDLLFAIIEEVQTSGMVVLERWRRADGDALGRLRGFVRDYAVFTIDERIKASVFDREFRSLTGERRAVLVAERDLYDRFLRELLRQAQREGTVPDGLDPVVVGNVVFQMVNSTWHWYSPGGRRTPAEIADTIADLVVAGAAGFGAAALGGGRARPRSCGAEQD